MQDYFPRKKQKNKWFTASYELPIIRGAGGTIMRPHQKKKMDQKTSKRHTTAHLALCPELPEEKLHRVFSFPLYLMMCLTFLTEERRQRQRATHTGRHHLHACAEKVAQTSEAKDGLPSFLEAVFGDWRRATVGTPSSVRALCGKQNKTTSQSTHLQNIPLL